MLRHAAYVLPILCALWILDNALSEDRYVGWERNSVRNSARRWAQRPKAKVVILGSSTSKDWIDPRWLARVVGVKPNEVLDAHINGCHQGCTLAEVRRLLQRGHHFQKAFFGTNQFQLCEYPHSKRVLQQQMMTPALEVPSLFATYLSADQPLLYIGRFGGMTLSGAYGDTTVLQKRWADEVFGRTDRRNAHRWVREKLVRTKPDESCPYREDDIALKRAMSGALLDEMAELADQTFLMFLPDRTLSVDDDEFRGRWAAHRALHESLAAERPHVSFVDLVTGGVHARRDYRDSIHLHRKAMGRQRTLFQTRLRELGAAK